MMDSLLPKSSLLGDVTDTANTSGGQALDNPGLMPFQEAVPKRTKKVHPFDLAPAELANIKALFPEFKQPRNTSEHKLQGLAISKLRDALIEKIPVPLELIDKIISRIDRRSDETVYWNEFLNSLSDEGMIREIVADSQIYGFGVKRL